MQRKKLIKLLIIALTTNFVLSCQAYAAYEGKSYMYDDYGNSIAAPACYYVEKIIDGEDAGTTLFSNPQDLFVTKNGDIYIADSGNNRIVVLNSEYQLVRVITEMTGTKNNTFKAPKGIYVDIQGNIYICDNENSRVVKTDSNGKYINEFLTPNTDLLPKDFIFKPEKVVADSTGTVYVQVFGIYQGLVEYDKDGSFTSFFGSNKVEPTFSVIATYFWKRLFTKSQREAMERLIPVEYSNIFLDDNDFIYTTTLNTQHSLDEAKKLNALGNNVLKVPVYNTYYPKNDFGDIEKEWAIGSLVDNKFVDIHVDSDGIISLLDIERGRMFQYGADNDLLMIFGTDGNQKGSFRKAISLEKTGEKYVILDADKGTITVIVPTYYANLLREAIQLYSDGKYIEALEMWKEINKKNTSLSISNKSIGKAYLQQEKYRDAMTYLKKGNDRMGFSQALKEYRKVFIRRYIALIVPCIILFLILLSFTIKKAKKYCGFGVDIKGKNLR